VVADAYRQSGTGDIGVLQNSGTGTFPTTSIYRSRCLTPRGECFSSLPPRTV
jgi:hypothetical protein